MPRGGEPAKSCAPNDVPAATRRLQRELKSTREALGQLRAEAAERLARVELDRLAASAERYSVMVLPDTPIDVARKVAASIATRPNTLVVVGAELEAGVQVVVTRGEGSSVPCGDVLKRLAQLAGGRGGGRPERAEGRLPSGVDLPALVEQALGELELTW